MWCEITCCNLLSTSRCLVIYKLIKLLLKKTFIQYRNVTVKFIAMFACT